MASGRWQAASDKFGTLLKSCDLRLATCHAASLTLVRQVIDSHQGDALATDIRRVDKAAGIRRFIPILSWLPRYDRSWLSVDIIAGLTLWGLVVPEAMAYAGIAGLPPQAGLYTLVASLLIYALLGSSRHLVVQGTSATAALLASSVGAALVATASATASDPQTYQAYASAFVLVTGVVFLAAGLARLGFIT